MQRKILKILYFYVLSFFSGSENEFVNKIKIESNLNS
jgi:hypothetical protein